MVCKYPRLSIFDTVILISLEITFMEITVLKPIFELRSEVIFLCTILEDWISESIS